MEWKRAARTMLIGISGIFGIRTPPEPEETVMMAPERGPADDPPARSHEPHGTTGQARRSSPLPPGVRLELPSGRHRAPRRPPGPRPPEV